MHAKTQSKSVVGKARCPKHRLSPLPRDSSNLRQWQPNIGENSLSWEYPSIWERPSCFNCLLPLIFNRSCYFVHSPTHHYSFSASTTLSNLLFIAPSWRWNSNVGPIGSLLVKEILSSFLGQCHPCLTLVQTCKSKLRIYQ